MNSRRATAGRQDDGSGECRWRAALAALLIAVGVLLALTPGDKAFAHASLLRAEPADGSVLAQSPAAITLSFNEPVTATILRLIEPAGNGRELPPVKTEARTLTIPLPALGAGTHGLSWRVVSADGHPVGGTLVFSVGQASAAGPSGVQSRTPFALDSAIWLARVLLYLALFAGVGGAFFDAWIDVERSHSGRRAREAALIGGLIAAAVSPGLQGADMLGDGLAAGLKPHAWQVGAASSFGITLAIAAGAIGLALIAGRARSISLARACALLALPGVGLALTASGHASDAPPQWLSRPAVLLHTMGLALWIGALLPLGVSLATRSPASVRSLARFSALIPIPLGLLIAAGLALAAIQLESPRALLATAYGRVLTAKLALVSLLLALAAFNRWRLTSAVEQGRPGAARRMRRTIVAEAALALAILGLVALWRFTPPPRALAAAAQARQPAHVHIHADRAAADVTVTPGRVGPASISVSVFDGELKPLNARQVDLALANPGAGIEPIHAQTRRIGGADWRVERVVIPAPGRWTVRVSILLDEFTLVPLDGELAIAR